MPFDLNNPAAPFAAAPAEPVSKERKAMDKAISKAIKEKPLAAGQEVPNKFFEEEVQAPRRELSEIQRQHADAVHRSIEQAKGVHKLWREQYDQQRRKVEQANARISG
ncbi:uncharacterized protein BO97DRAFT_428230 [Aspergillus homomorphus CBS 101889]|uniref:Uncharacterized protein n=1 Tax=Aspergillus homomorphus (strain CBS 101889) TaxID=1450537 RepID=A0A395HKV3_ASPHC|nr:hypothetical protein BO97DRAFT_428230 [Aspergillus homomorphus CBS 101889]RAL08581.1 hypothetical protein BO97DRAFT_428230 [Aspergillus homomorphus CBS 101889]